MDISNLEDLNEFLESKNEEVQNLKDELSEIKRKQDIEFIKWQLPKAFVVDDLRKDLPYPRLEMRIQKEGYQTVWIYGIVCRRYECDNLKEQVFMPLNKTTTSASIEQVMNQNDKLPWRDGTHIRTDLIAFNMRAFLICEERGFLEEINPFGKENQGIINKSNSELIKK